MKLESAWLTDVRVQARHLKKGLLEQKQLEKHLKDLPDLSSQVETVSMPQPALSEDGAPSDG
ncbi:MAG: hypothetical protein IT374_00465 [Polyangiaceae bacterium]|nr:hypothetical protein [Polyangiaceae bacterium]